MTSLISASICARIAASLLLIAVQIPWIAYAKQPQEQAKGQSKTAGLSETNLQDIDLVPLKSAEIKTALTERELSVDRSLTPGHGVLIEQFLADGTWKTWRAESMIVKRRGEWRIENDQICTVITWAPTNRFDPERVCRQVWRDGASGSIAMLDPFGSTPFILRYSSSALKMR